MCQTCRRLLRKSPMNPFPSGGRSGATRRTRDLIFHALSCVCAIFGHPDTSANQVDAETASLQRETGLSALETRESTSCFTHLVQRVGTTVPILPPFCAFPLPLNSTAQISKTRPPLTLLSIRFSIDFHFSIEDCYWYWNRSIFYLFFINSCRMLRMV